MKSLRNVKIEKCKDIGAIFRECTSLKEIRISESVQYIAGEAFRECSSLEKVYVCNPDTRIEINSFEATPKLTMYGYSGSTAQEFAKKRGIRFQDIRTAEPSIISITLNATSGNMKVGNTFTLKATVKPDNAIVKSVTWTSSNSKIASVSASGKGMAEYSVQS